MFSHWSRLTLLTVLTIPLVFGRQSQSVFNTPGNTGTRHAQYTNAKTVTKPKVNADWGSSYDEGLFSPLEELSALSEDGFTTMEHPAFPNHSVRIKKTPAGFCDDSVRSVYNLFSCFTSLFDLAYSTYTGYIDIEARHLFFYFFESRSNPDKDDVIFWTNGGQYSLLTSALSN